MLCEKCNSNEIVKNGKVRGKQRYLCKKCGYNFTEGDGRQSSSPELKVLCQLMSILAKGQYQKIGEYMEVDRSLVYKWVNSLGVTVGKPGMDDEVYNIEDYGGINGHLENNCKGYYYEKKPLIAVSNSINDEYGVTVIVQKY